MVLRDGNLAVEERSQLGSIVVYSHLEGYLADSSGGVDWEGSNVLVPSVAAYACLETLHPGLGRPRYGGDHDNSGQDDIEDAAGDKSDHAKRPDGGSGCQESGGVVDSRRGDNIDAAIAVAFLILHILHCEATIAAIQVDGMNDVHRMVMEDKKKVTSGEEDSHVA